MNVQRGDVVLAFYPFASGVGGSRRPALVVQSDAYNPRIRNAIIAQITTNLSRASDPAHLLIEAATSDGRQAGLLHDSVISCINLATIETSRIDRVIGRLTAALMRQIDECLKRALDIP
jgi:mRNA-degrading endonuclease toxin of MazEF toxin-antitoxin module